MSNNEEEEGWRLVFQGQPKDGDLDMTRISTVTERMSEIEGAADTDVVDAGEAVCKGVTP